VATTIVLLFLSRTLKKKIENEWQEKAAEVKGGNKKNLCTRGER